MAEGMFTALADACLGNADDYTWIKHHTGAPGSAGTSNAATNTTRQQVTWGSAGAGPVANSRGKSNTGAVSWTSVPATEDYSHFTAHDASTAGNVGFSGVTTANAVTAGDTFTFPIGDLDIYFPIAS